MRKIRAVKKVGCLLFIGLTILMLSGCNTKTKEYDEKDKKEDTEAPIVNLTTNYVFSNKLEDIDFTVLSEIKDSSSYTEKLCKFQKIDNAKQLDEVAVKEYSDKFSSSDTDELLKRADNVPVEDGIYTAVYLVEDAYGNKTAKEVVIFYDTTAALVSGLEELNTEIEVDNVNAKYEDDLLDHLTIVDAFDGIIVKDMLMYTMEPTGSNIYTVKAEYTDRAGNKTFIEYEIKLKEKKKEIVYKPTIKGDTESNTPESNTPEGNIPEINAPESSTEFEDTENGSSENEDTSDTSHYIPTPEEWYLIVVNKWNNIPENYAVELTELPNGEKVDSRIYPALQQMFDDAKEEGLYMIVREGYRTMEEQQQQLDVKTQAYMDEGYSKEDAEKKAKEWVAVPGTSEHQLGLAVDINADSLHGGNTGVYRWLAKNAYKYGFILRYPAGKKDITGISYEPWHYRYVGVEVAKEIYERGICLEEYFN